MLSYQHIYHAGNFADVHKHSLLIEVLRALKNKKKPLFYIDTHAGRGIYDLHSKEAQKTGEYRNGILQCTTPKHPALRNYFDIIHNLNPDSMLRYYPGSSLLALQQLSPRDEAVLCELHPREFKELQSTFSTGTDVQVLHVDGMKELAQRLPPSAQAGLIVIDPSYEIKTEYQTIPQQAIEAQHRWPQGCLLLWYPILAKRPHLALLEHLRAHAQGMPILVSELVLDQIPKEGFALQGSGVALFNSPLSTHEIETLGGELKDMLAPKGEHRVFSG